ncbi:DNA alkylation repair protein [Aliiroseovarius crassostreae]|uniref:DNA alkylation repair protein n=1 Tax=Aliiroseovarius crassostreae TaxID=154981 RepID=UPI003C7A1623
MSEGFSLKDQLINAEKVALLAGWLQRAAPGFEAAAFQAQVMARLPELELKARILWIAEVLEDHLPDDFSAAAEVIHKALPPELDPTNSDDDFGDFIIDPFGQFVARNGLDDLDAALPLLHALTRRFSMEFAIRPFLIRHKARMQGVLSEWARDENYHVRRLASEGCRPNLPWGARIGWNVAETIPILNALHADPTRYVTRSVANHLNDIAKTAPDLVVDTLSRWRDVAQQDPKELAWMTRHACRTLIKQGHPGALDLLGFRPDAQVEMGEITLTPADGQVPIDTKLDFAFDLTATREEPVIVDYVIRFQRPGGKIREKVFKLKNLTMTPGQTLRLSKSHFFKGNATTFRLYPGTHYLMVQVNGQMLGGVPFALI